MGTMRAMIVFNPTAGQSGASALERDLNAAADVWREHDWHVDLSPTSGPGDGIQLANSASKKRYDVVLAAGGDGTINEVINGLAGSNTVMAPLPLGTMNVWARELGLPMNARAAAEKLLSWKVRTIDLGRAGGRYFLLMAGIGLDAAITAGVRPEEKRRLGAIAYVLTAMVHIVQVRGTRAQLVIDGKKVKGHILMVVVGNSQLYGGVMKITHRATIDDGLLDVCVIRGNGLGSMLTHIIAIFTRSFSSDPEIEYYRARTVHIAATPTLPVQIDGDTFGKTPMTFEIVPRALRVLMPQHLADDLVRNYSPEPLRAGTLRRMMGWMRNK